jgi:hypothetical protein
MAWVIQMSDRELTRLHKYGINRPIILCCIATITALLLPSFDPERTSEHGIASIDVQHLSRNETGGNAGIASSPASCR